MGRITRLNTTFTNPDLPRLIDYDTRSIEAQILSLPTLRSWHDATSPEYRVVSSGKITQLTDRKGSGRNFVQADTGLAPSLASAGINGAIDAAYFDGTMGMRAASFFAGASTSQTVVALIVRNDATNTSRIFLSDADNAQQGFYSQNGFLMALNSSLQLPIPGGTSGRAMDYVCAVDYVADTGRLYGGGLTASGTTTVAVPTGDANLGRWHDATESNKFVGHIGHVMLFDEDLSRNPAVLSLVQEYALRRYRMS